MKKHLSILCTFILIIFSQLSVHSDIYAQIYTWEKVCTIPKADITCLYVNEKEDIFYGSQSGVFRSTDAGASWMHIDKRTGVAVLTSHQGCIYAGGSGLYKSSNDGNTWTYLGTSGEAVYSLGFNSNGYIYTGGTHSVGRTTNEGIKWTIAWLPGDGSAAQGVLFLHVNPKDNIIIGARGSWGFGRGIYRSLDDGLKWSNTDLRFDPMCICRDIDGKLYVGSESSGLFFSRDEGLHWDSQQGLEGKSIRSILVDSTGVVVAGTNYGIFQSSDKGKTWINCFENKVTKMCLSATGKIYVLEGDTNIYRSEQSILPPLQPVLASPPDQDNCKPNEITLEWKRSQYAIQYHLQTATDQQFIKGIFLNDSTIIDISRTVSGLSDTSKYYWRVRAGNIAGFSPWSNIRSFGTAGGSIQSPLISSPGNKQSIPWRKINLQWNFNPCANSYHVQLSNDSDFASIVLNDSSVTSSNLFISQLQAGVTFYWRVRARMGTIFSNWSAISRFITDAPTYEPFLISNINSISLSQNSPNPFSTSTVIGYKIASATHVRLEVFDFLGRKIATLVDEEKDIGEYTSTFDIRFSVFNFQSGLYLYRLTSGQNIMTRKMIVMIQNQLR